LVVVVVGQSPASRQKQHYLLFLLGVAGRQEKNV
jgi:hypothetical protein